MSEVDPYLLWLGIRAPERPPNHYRLLGLELFEQDADVIANAADRQMAHVRAYQMGKYAALSQSLLNELTTAKLCLLDPHQRAVYDQSLHRRLTAESGHPWPDSAPQPMPSASDTMAVPMTPPRGVPVAQPAGHTPPNYSPTGYAPTGCAPTGNTFGDAAGGSGISLDLPVQPQNTGSDIHSVHPSSSGVGMPTPESKIGVRTDDENQSILERRQSRGSGISHRNHIGRKKSKWQLLKSRDNSAVLTGLAVLCCCITVAVAFVLAPRVLDAFAAPRELVFPWPEQYRKGAWLEIANTEPSRARRNGTSTIYHLDPTTNGVTVTSTEVRLRRPVGVYWYSANRPGYQPKTGYVRIERSDPITKVHLLAWEGETEIHIVWSLHDREHCVLKIDGEVQNISPDEALVFGVAAGSHNVQIYRFGDLVFQSPVFETGYMSEDKIARIIVPRLSVPRKPEPREADPFSRLFN